MIVMLLWMVCVCFVALMVWFVPGGYCRYSSSENYLAMFGVFFLACLTLYNMRSPC
jgi:hypothetical protein